MEVYDDFLIDDNDGDIVGDNGGDNHSPITQDTVEDNDGDGRAWGSDDDAAAMLVHRSSQPPVAASRLRKLLLAPC